MYVAILCGYVKTNMYEFEITTLVHTCDIELALEC